MSIPINFTGLHLRNFLSFGANLTEIDLTFFGTTLIMGENLDAGGQNGCGKTSIINAICYALFNKPFDNISLQRLINTTNNAKNTLMEVRLFLTKGELEYEIYRCRGETFNIQILCNGEDITLDSVTGNDKLVQEIIGISYELFTKIIIFSGNSTPFLVLPVSQQRAQIEELFNITLLTEKALILKEKIKQTEGDIKVQEAVITQIDSTIKTYNKQLVEAANRITKWDNDRARQIASLIAIQNAQHIDLELERGYHDLIASLKPQIAALKTEQQTSKSKQQASEKLYNKLKSELEHLVVAKCPYCLQKYEQTDQKIAEIEKQLASEQELSSQYTKLINAVTEGLDDLDAQLKLATGLTQFSSLVAAVQAKTSADSAQNRIDELSKDTNPHIEAHEGLKANAIDEINYDALNALKKELEHQAFLLKLLTDKNSFIRRRIINQTIPFLNARLNGYTRELGLQHIVKFDDDMSCVVSEYGRELDFGNLSSGEKKRVNFSLSLAFRDVLHHIHAKVNCLFVDEIDASLDTGGVEAIFKLLKIKARTDNLSLWVISHRPEAIGRFDRNLLIRKESGFSQIVQPEE